MRPRLVALGRAGRTSRSFRRLSAKHDEKQRRWATRRRPWGGRVLGKNNPKNRRSRRSRRDLKLFLIMRRFKGKAFFKRGFVRSRRHRRHLTRIHLLQNLLPLMKSRGNAPKLLINFLLLSTGNPLCKPVLAPRYTADTPRNRVKVKPYLFAGGRACRSRPYLTRLLRKSLNRLRVRRRLRRRASYMRRFRVRKLLKYRNRKHRPRLKSTKTKAATRNFNVVITYRVVNVLSSLVKICGYRGGYEYHLPNLQVSSLGTPKLLMPNPFSKVGHLSNTLNLPPVVHTLQAKRSPNHNVNIITKVSAPFILLSYGLFVVSRLYLPSTVFDYVGYKYRFKKKYFSFLYPSQLKRSVLMRKKRVLVSRFFLKSRFKRSRPSSRFSAKPFFTAFKSIFLSKLKGSSLFGSVFSGRNVSYENPKQGIVYRNDFRTKGLDMSFQSDEVFIPRVRFKPGYQRL